MSPDPNASAVPVGEAPYPAPVVAWYATITLAFLYWFSILDRFIISLLVDPIKRDMGISDLQFGLLHGFAFAITFALFGLIAGALADRASRRWIIFASVAVWSMATAACGMAQQYWHLLLARVGVGVGEAGLNPTASSMLADLFPRHRLTSAMAVYAIGSTVGAGTAYLVGGVIVDMVSQTDMYIFPLIGETRSWQAVFLILGIPGVLLSLIIFTLPEPVRRNRRTAQETDSLSGNLFSAYPELMKFMASRLRYFLCHYGGFGVASAVIAGGGAWYPAHMGRSFGWSASQIGLSLGITIIIAGIAGKLFCGYVVDAMYSRGFRDAQLRWYAACLLVATPIGVLANTSDNPWVFLGGIGVFLILLSPLPACYIAALNLVTPNELRGTGVAFFSATAGLIGMGGGPILIAAISENIFNGPSDIGLGLAALVAICCPLGAVLLALGCRPTREALVEFDKNADV
ncbi:MAG: MFS transporter [Halioglobus sp.]|nr:MFS transporter [Halioglobus sp.]